MDREQDATVCICGNEVAIQCNKLIDFGDPARPALSFFELYLLRLLVYIRVVALFFANQFKAGIVIGKGSPA